MDWYVNGGATEMSTAGSMCEIETMNKSGETAQLAKIATVTLG
jgi:hypothetical protein